MKMGSYWLDTATPSGDYTETTLPTDVDLAVVGGGFTGLSTALYAARAGLSVALLESNTVMWGASGRNGGMATNGLGIGFRSAVEKYGAEQAKAYIDEYNVAVDLLEQLVTENQLDVDFERKGKVILASKASHVEGLRKTHDLLRDVAGHRVQFVERDQLRTLVGSDAFFAGIAEEDSAALHVAKFGHELARLAIEAGATIHEHAEVIGVERIGNGTTHDVTTSRGRLRAGKVLVGTSGYTTKAFGWMQRRVVPVGSFVTATEVLPQELVDEIAPGRRTASNTRNLLHYWRITPDNRLLFGGRAKFALSDHSKDRESGAILVQARDEVFPQLAKYRTDYMWGGLVDISLDRMVHAGLHDGLYYSMAYSGHGVQMATLMGKVMTEVMTGSPQANPWRDLKNPWIPAHFGNTWLHLRLGGAYYSYKDKTS